MRFKQQYGRRPLRRRIGRKIYLPKYMLEQEGGSVSSFFKGLFKKVPGLLKQGGKSALKFAKDNYTEDIKKELQDSAAQLVKAGVGRVVHNINKKSTDLSKIVAIPGVDPKIVKQMGDLAIERKYVPTASSADATTIPAAIPEVRQSRRSKRSLPVVGSGSVIDKHLIEMLGKVKPKAKPKPKSAQSKGDGMYLPFESRQYNGRGGGLRLTT